MLVKPSKINHWVLLKKLINCQNIFGKIIVLLVSTPVTVCQMGINYVNQVSGNKRCAPRGVISPLLCYVYINELSELLNKSGIGGYLGGTIINHMLYAHDICIFYLSSSGLQHLLNICSDYCERHDLTFNARKIYVHVFQYLYK